MGEISVAICIVLIVSSSAFTSEGKIQDIKIGALYSNKTESLFRVLEYVINYLLPKRLLQPQNYKFTLGSHVMVDGQDLLSKELLSNFSKVKCIIDLACEDEKALDVSTVLQVPLMKVDSLKDSTIHPYVVSIRPSKHLVSQALFDIMDFFSFTRIAVVYDVSRMREASHFYATMRRWPRFDIHIIPELVLNDRKKLRESLKRILHSHIRDIVIFCDQRDLAHIMNEALFVGINDKDYRWITPDLEVAGANQTYPSILGMVGLRLHVGDEQQARVLRVVALKGTSLEYSLSVYASVYDAAVTVGMALTNVIAGSDDMTQISLTRVSNATCALRRASTQHKGPGWKLLQHIREVKFQGVTGEVQFDQVTGERRLHNGLDILNIAEDEVKKVGSWRPEPGIRHYHVSLNENEKVRWVGDFAEIIKCHNPGATGPHETEPLPRLKVTTFLEEPFVEKVNESVRLPKVGKKVPKTLLQGFCIDLIEELSKLAKFEYDIYLDKNYDGLVEELTQQKKDIALGPITITAEREMRIDFSKPFMDFSISLIMQKPGEPAIDIFAFLMPFTGVVWLSIVGVVLGMTVVMYAMDYLSPFGYHARAQAANNEPGNEFNLLNSLWFATASILQQGPDNTPLAPSGRLLASAFWFFTLILISTYTANLAAFFTIKRTVATINSLEELENQTEIKYGVLRGGSLQKFFQNSGDQLYRRMFSHMREYDTAVNCTAEGVEKARTEQYAYLTEQPFLEYYNHQKCNTRLLNNLLQSQAYGIGLQKDSEYTNEISVAILKLRERNFVERIRHKWWDERSKCPKPKQSKTGNTKRLDLNNMAGVFLVLVGGVIISLVLVVFEMRCKKLVEYFTSGQATIKRQSRCESHEYEPIDRTVRVKVVLAKGDKVLTPKADKRQKKSTWNNLLNK
ncbi:glutamate receptor 2-like [Porites lutea]|uniref:glutamate receptor 2-like n=1 Tax=Porites lutea TaxID=51062 RepID=UPI003CC63C0B